MQLVTFDIFDTVLLRRCGRPEVVAELLAREMFPDDMAAREDLILRRKRASGELTLKQIWTKAEQPEGAEREMAVESDVLMANPAMLEVIDDYRQRGWTVKFLSDMYLSSDFLTDVLKREGAWEDGDEVIVSCEWDARKDMGTLYKAVRERFNPAEWHHYGDNHHSDVKMARKHGVKAHQVMSGFTPAENAVMAKANDMRDGWMLKLLAGLSRAARLTCGASDCNSGQLTLAADHVAPVYIPFVNFALQTAKERGADRVHFLSRDGWIMDCIAKGLDSDGDAATDLMFVSRRSLMPAYLADADVADYLMVVDKHTLIRKDVDALLWQLQTSREEMQRDYNTTFNYNKITTKEQQSDFLDKIFHNGRFTTDWQQRCRQAREITVDYLRQMSQDAGKQLMVDVGWLGTSRLMITKILRDAGMKPMDTVYLGVRQDVYSCKYGSYVPYFRAGELDTYATALIEAYFSAAPWPSTIGYRKCEGTDELVPQFAEGESYCDTAATDANALICSQIAAWIAELPFEIPAVVQYAWCNTSLYYIAHLKGDVALEPLAGTDGVEKGCGLVKRLSPKELVSIVLLGGRATGFDRGSVAYTVGRRLGAGLWRVHELTGRIRGALFRRFILRG